MDKAALLDVHVQDKAQLGLVSGGNNFKSSSEVENNTGEILGAFAAGDFFRVAVVGRLQILVVRNVHRNAEFTATECHVGEEGLQLLGLGHVGAVGTLLGIVNTLVRKETAGRIKHDRALTLVLELLALVFFKLADKQGHTVVEFFDRMHTDNFELTRDEAEVLDEHFFGSFVFSVVPEDVVSLLHKFEGKVQLGNQGLTGSEETHRHEELVHVEALIYVAGQSRVKRIGTAVDESIFRSFLVVVQVLITCLQLVKETEIWGDLYACCCTCCFLCHGTPLFFIRNFTG